jgi:hypothetical protein
MLTTTNDKHSDSSPSSPTLDLAQARRCGKAALRRYNPDPAVIDEDLATAIALEQQWLHEGEPYTPTQIATRVYVCTSSTLRIALEHGPAGLTGLTTHYEFARRCALAVKKLRLAQNRECPKYGIEPSVAEVINHVNDHRRRGCAARAEDWQISYTTTINPEIRGRERDHAEMICAQDEAKRTLSEIAQQLSPLAQQALALSLEWGGVLPTHRELSEITGVSISTAGQAIQEIKRVAKNLRDPAPIDEQGGK